MSKLKSLVIICTALLFLAGLSTIDSAVASTEETTEPPPIPVQRSGEKYVPGDSLASISSAMVTAGNNNKLVLVIMGANWCHDSRALASRIENLPLSNIIGEHYETVFVDVGYLDKGKDVITSLGVPIYYATPSVLIVDPVSRKLINADNRHQWGNAANINMDDSVTYFQQMATSDLGTLRTETTLPEELRELLADIDAFEQLQAERLYLAYTVLSPMLYAYDNGDPDKFSDKTWSEVGEFRSKVPGDMDALRLEAHQRAAAGDKNIELKYPTYRAFSWEKKPLE
jgi:hypothetical protein